MTAAIRFLEKLGSGPVQHGGRAAYLAALAESGVEGAEREALSNADPDALNALLGGRTRMNTQIWAPQEDAPKRDDDKPAREDDGQEDDKPDDPPDR